MKTLIYLLSNENKSIIEVIVGNRLVVELHIIHGV